MIKRLETRSSMMALTCRLKTSALEWMFILIPSTAHLNLRVDLQARHLLPTALQGVSANQSKSDISIGRYKLTILGGKRPTDAAAYTAHKIGFGTNQVLGFPREGEVGYTAATGIRSTPAVATGAEALVDMQNAFTLTTAGTRIGLMLLSME